MSQDMPRPRPPYLLKETTRHGKTVWYVRKGDGPRTPIRGEYGSPEFQAAYEAAYETVRAQAAFAPPEPKARAGSLSWLWDRYRETDAWSTLSPATRRQRENIMLHVLEKSGHHPCTAVNEESIEAAKDQRRATPAQARNFLDAMRGLFRWAKKAKKVKTDPTINIDNPRRKKGPGFLPWNEDDVAAYQKRWPIGTKERVWLDVLLYTGPRRGDATRLGRQHVRTMVDEKTGATSRVISFKTEKGGELIEVTIPLLPVLEKTLEAGPCGDLTFIVGDRGHPLKKESFGNMFSAAARAAGVNKSAHGVRKIAATTCADNGATEHQLMAIFGWKTTQMAEFYTREANRRRLAREAAHMLTNAAREIGAGDAQKSA